MLLVSARLLFFDEPPRVFNCVSYGQRIARADHPCTGPSCLLSCSYTQVDSSNESSILLWPINPRFIGFIHVYGFLTRTRVPFQAPFVVFKSATLPNRFRLVPPMLSSPICLHFFFFSRSTTHLRRCMFFTQLAAGNDVLSRFCQPSALFITSAATAVAGELTPFPFVSRGTHPPTTPLPLGPPLATSPAGNPCCLFPALPDRPSRLIVLFSMARQFWPPPCISPLSPRRSTYECYPFLSFWLHFLPFFSPPPDC